ncbi:MAG: thioredoxin family protein [Bacteroidia bacterium]|nr:thioredoxin family protein [Bacteroidia bacterium]
MKHLKALVIFPLLVVLFGFTPKEEAEKVEWIGIEEAVKLSEKDGKKIIVDLYTDWCGWCKKMDRETFNNSKVAALINEHYHAVKFNPEKVKEITLKGRTYKYLLNSNGRGGTNEFAYRLANGKLGYPTIAILDADASRLTAISGYKKAKEFLPIIGYFAEDDYKSKSWAQFYKEFQRKE